MACEDCGSIYTDHGFCRSCAEHRADGHAPRMAYSFPATIRIKQRRVKVPIGTWGRRDGWCHGDAPFSKTDFPLPEELLPSLDERDWWRVSTVRERL